MRCETRCAASDLARHLQTASSMKPNALLLSAILVPLAISGRVRAEDRSATDAAATHPVTTLPQPPTVQQPLIIDEQPLVDSWYGWQTLIADGTVALLGLVALPIGYELQPLAEAIGVTALGTYVLAAPIVHFVHGNVARGFGSLGLRAVLPLAFGAIGAKVESCVPGQWFCGLSGALVGGAIGVVSAAIIDGAVLAREKVPARSTATAPNVGFMFDGKRASVVLHGTF
jgi:hypothetical protein